MRRSLIISVLLLAMVFSVTADRRRMLLARNAEAGTSASYLVRQTFEGTGYDNGETWTATGSPDPDYTGTVLQGSQSYRHNQAAAAMHAVTTVTNNGTVHGYFLLRPVTIDNTGSRNIATVEAAGGTIYLTIRVVNTGAMRILHGATTATTVSAISAGNTYHVWWTYTPGTGSDGFASIAFSTDGTKPTSGNAYVETTTGTATGQMAQFRLGTTAANTMEYIYDSVLIDNATIPSNPSY